MLLREQPGGGVLAIAQPAHAALAGRLAEAWGHALSADLLVATAHHDDVWTAWDAAPRWSPATGCAMTFLELEPAERVAVWSQASQRATPLGPAAELWVLRHAARLHADYDDHALKAMTASISTRIAELAAELRAADASRFDDGELARGTSLLALFDALSLALCFGVNEPKDAGVLRLTPATDGAVAVAPWPFAGARVETYVEARRLPGRVTDQGELDAAWAAAAPSEVTITLVPGA